MYSTLITATELHRHLHDPQFVIVDCRFDLTNPNAGRAAYHAGHIPGAVYAHLDDDLSGPLTAHSGRHPLPDARILADTFGRWNIDDSKQVIAYDANTGAMAAARLWWLLRWLGHPHVAVLNGGLMHWQAAGFELTSSVFTPAPGKFKGMPQASWISTADEVARCVQQKDWRVIDARAPERYAGSVEPIDAVAGHIPGARNYPLNRNLHADGQWLPAATLRTQFSELLGDTAPTHVISMCGSGVTACHNLLALEVAGLPGAKLYPGSWSEWIKDGTRPIKTDPTP
jgi:thiosulfate/3-mercaptopyruvate sulfurtransferase